MMQLMRKRSPLPGWLINIGGAVTFAGAVIIFASIATADSNAGGCRMGNYYQYGLVILMAGVLFTTAGMLLSQYFLDRAIEIYIKNMIQHWNNERSEDDSET